MQRDIHFSWSSNRPCPYAREVVEYVNDGSSGYIVFNGYWYRREEDTPLPRPIEFTAKTRATEPFETGVDANGDHFEKYR